MHQGPVSPRSRKVFATGKPYQSLKSYDYRAVVIYSDILNMKRGFLHIRSFRRLHLSVFGYRLIKNGFASPKSFRGFSETGPCWFLRAFGDIPTTPRLTKTVEAVYSLSFKWHRPSLGTTTPPSWRKSS